MEFKKISKYLDALEDCEEKKYLYNLASFNVPKKPKVFYCRQTQESPEEFEVYCPTCEAIINAYEEYQEFEYCPICGQALKFPQEER